MKFDKGTPGCYQLLIHLAEACEMEIGKLGSFYFPEGYYLYTGSALRGLKSRIARHLRSSKKLHWHVDYLLMRALVVKIYAMPGEDRQECHRALASLELPGAKVLVPRFGSSDCRCPAHLTYLGVENEPARQEIKRWGFEEINPFEWKD